MAGGTMLAGGLRYFPRTTVGLAGAGFVTTAGLALGATTALLSGASRAVDVLERAAQRAHAENAIPPRTSQIKTGTTFDDVLHDANGEQKLFLAVGLGNPAAPGTLRPPGFRFYQHLGFYKGATPSGGGGGGASTTITNKPPPIAASVADKQDGATLVSRAKIFFRGW
jgi:hypothetical protein